MSKTSDLERETKKEDIAFKNSQFLSNLSEQEQDYVSSCCTANAYGNIHEFDGEHYGLCGKCKDHTSFIDINKEEENE
jgi:hypothetical protein